MGKIFCVILNVSFENNHPYIKKQQFQIKLKF